MHLTIQIMGATNCPPGMQSVETKTSGEELAVQDFIEPTVLMIGMQRQENAYAGTSKRTFGIGPPVRSTLRKLKHFAGGGE